MFIVYDPVRIPLFSETSLNSIYSQFEYFREEFTVTTFDED